MLLGGLWHGASWTFIIWGAYHGMLLVFHRLLRPIVSRISMPRHFLAQKMWTIISIVFFFHLVCLGWLIFRAQSLSQIYTMLKTIAFIHRPIFTNDTIYMSAKLIFFTLPLIIIQIMQYKKNTLFVFSKSNIFVRATFYCTYLLLIIIFGVTGAQKFIYFQF